MCWVDTEIPEPLTTVDIFFDDFPPFSNYDYDEVKLFLYSYLTKSDVFQDLREYRIF